MEGTVLRSIISDFSSIEDYKRKQYYKKKEAVLTCYIYIYCLRIYLK